MHRVISASLMGLEVTCNRWQESREDKMLGSAARLGQVPFLSASRCPRDTLVVSRGDLTSDPSNSDY